MAQESTALIKVNPQVDIQFLEYQKQAQDILKYVRAAVVTNEAEMKASTNDLGIISRLKKGIEECRQFYVRPLNDHVKTINAAFKTLTDPVEEADKTLRDVITKYRVSLEIRRAEAEEINRQKEDLARREAALNQGVITVDTTPVIVPEAPAAHVRAEAATLGTTKTWKFEVVDFDALPEEYKLPDLIKIRKVVQAGVAIPGVRSWQEDSIRISTR